MTELSMRNKLKLRDEVELRNYNIIWAGGKYPNNKEECQIIYIDMDNQPAICNARYYCEIENNGLYRKKKHRFIRTSDSAKMCDVVAWKLR